MTHISALIQYLKTPVNSHMLGLFRCAFGLFLVVFAWRYFYFDFTTSYYVYHHFHIPLFWTMTGGYSAWLLNGLVLALLVSAIGIATGRYFRQSCAIWLIGLGVLMSLDKTLYTQTQELILWSIAILACTNAHNSYVYKNPINHTVERWEIISLKVFLCILLLWLGVSHSTKEWLNGDLIRHFMSENFSETPLLLQFFNHPISTKIISIGLPVIEFLSVILLWKSPKWRWLFLGYLGIIHYFSNVLTTQFGTSFVPLIMGLFTLLFWEASDLEKIKTQYNHWISTRLKKSKIPIEKKIYPIPLICSLGMFIIFQTLYPLSLYKDPTWYWNGSFTQFCWTMKSHTSTIDATFIILDPSTNRTLTKQLPPSYTKILQFPYGVLKAAHFIRNEYEQKTGRRPKIFIHITKTINTHPKALLIDPNVNLSDIEYNWIKPNPWILPTPN